MRAAASFVRGLDPRLKLGMALLLGPSVWLLSPVASALMTCLLLPLVAVLAAAQPLGRRMLRSIAVFLFFWVAIKSGLDAISGVPLPVLAENAGVLLLRLSALILLGLALALSTSARALGLAVSWGLRPLIGEERAWKVALSLALVVHFLPLCLSTMNRVQETVSLRCPEYGIFRRMTVIPQAVLRGLGQKTWNQTLAIAGRGLEGGDAWRPDFSWRGSDSLCAALAVATAILLILSH